MTQIDQILKFYVERMNHYKFVSNDLDNHYFIIKLEYPLSNGDIWTWTVNIPVDKVNSGVLKTSELTRAAKESILREYYPRWEARDKAEEINWVTPACTLRLVYLSYDIYFDLPALYTSKTDLDAVIDTANHAAEHFAAKLPLHTKPTLQYQKGAFND
jgi:hypothetical protein